jgi:Ser/Thr protein kinase RdoA (MazF antagonist)
VTFLIKVKYSFADTESLKDYISEAYNLPFYALDLMRDARGAIYSAFTLQNKYVFKLSNAYYIEKSVNAVNLLDFLRKRKFPAVKIIPTSKDELYITVPMPEGIRIGVLYEFIEGTAANYDNLDDVAKTSAWLHNELNEYKGFLPQLYSKRLMIDEMLILMRNVRYDETKIATLENIMIGIWDKTKDFPTAIVHGDLDMGNIIITNDGNIKLFDFDDTGYMPLIFDIACICNRIDDKLLTKDDVELTKKTIESFLKSYYTINSHVEYKASDILNWVALRRIDVQMIGVRFLVPKFGIQNHRHLDMFYKWLAEWQKMFF